MNIGERVPAQSCEMAALVNALERKGVIAQGQVLPQIRELKERAARAG